MTTRVQWVSRWRWRLALVAALAVGCDDGGSGGGAEPDARATGDARPADDSGRRDARLDDEDAGPVADATPRLPQCSDGIDNDGDGRIDFPEDPGCESPEDDDERNPPQCSDGIDNDGDGLIDYPADPGCASALDDDESSAAPLPACNDGIDNDRDGLVDQWDPGCMSPADTSEVDPAARPACSDGLDNDGDGVIDFPYDLGCIAAGDEDEDTPPTLPACANGVDDDNDGLVDFPEDPGCLGAGGRDETDKVVPPECADGVDNDLDGFIDWPDDDGCEAAGDYFERGKCRSVYDPPRLRDGVPVLLDTSRGRFETQGTCGGRGSPELVVRYKLEREIEALLVSTVSEQTRVPTTIYVRRTECLLADREVACQREELGAGEPGQTLRVESVSRGDYYIFVDGVAGEGGPVEVTITEVPLAQCLNGLDDDGDGRIDYPHDPGCESPTDRDETNPDTLPECSNDEDDDADGLIDYPLDPGCTSAAWRTEEDLCGPGVRFTEYFPGVPHVMGSTREEDGGTTAFTGSCGGAAGPEVVHLYRNPVPSRLVISTSHPETVAPTVVYVRRECGASNLELACDDGQAGGATAGRVTLNQAAAGDYWIIVDTRFGIGGVYKLTIASTPLHPECSDGVDNDGDGLVDFPEDPGCSAADDDSERG